MLSMFLALTAATIAGGAAQSEESQVHASALRDPNTTLVLVGTRHGNRNPDQFLQEELNATWGKEGPSELTTFGKRQAYGLGLALRRFIGDLVEPNYLPQQTKTFSSSANRCQMTLQAAMAATFPPQGFADWNATLNWTPVPYQINDSMLRMYSVSPCPYSDAAWQPITDDHLPTLVQLFMEKKPLIDYIAQHTGWNASISNTADVADNLIVIQLAQSTMPDWIVNPTLPGYNETMMVEEILEFLENHQIMCSYYPPCRNLMGGVWLNDLLNTLNKKANGTAKDLNLVFYASHTEVTLSVMKLMFYDKNSLTTSAGFVLEFRDSPAPSVRLLAHDPSSTNVSEHTIYQAKYLPALQAICPNNWCPLDAFTKLVDGFSINNWKANCGLPA